MLAATSAPPSRATWLAMRTAARFISSRSPSRPTILQLLAVRVVGQRDHDVSAGAQELAVQLDHRLRRVEDDLREHTVRP